MVSADESAEVGSDFPGKLLEVFARRVAREFITRCRSIRSNNDNRPVARIVGGRISKHVKRLLRILQVVNANVEDDVRADRFASDEQAAGAVHLICFSKNAADANADVEDGIIRSK